MVFTDHEQGLDKIPPHQLQWVMIMVFVNYYSIGKAGKVVLCGMDIGR